MKTRAEIIREQAGILLQPKNIAKTIASAAPFVSELINQIEDQATNGKIANLENDVRALQKLQELEKNVPMKPPLANTWAFAAGEYLDRTVDFAVVYDAGFHAGARRGHELIQPVAHACQISATEVVACVEAFELARHVADTKGGKLIILRGMECFNFEAQPADDASGLLLCTELKRDDRQWNIFLETTKKHNLHAPTPKAVTPVKYSLTPYIGDEIAFLHTAEARNVMRLDQFSRRQFDMSTISHFRRPAEGAIKTFVSGVLPGRVEHAGSPLFTRDGTLLGLIADTESFQSDAGRRVIGRSLLGHPRFLRDLKQKKAAL